MDIPEELKKSKRSEFKEDDNIDKLRSLMYSRERKGFLPWRRRSETPKEKPLVKESWEYNSPPKKSHNTTKMSLGWAKVLLAISVTFFIAAGVGAFAFLHKTVSPVSEDNVDITIEGSTSAVSGSVLELQVLITNRNDSSLELADAVITYPDGTVSPIDFKTPLDAERLPLGLVEARSARRGTISAVILGNAGETKKIKVELQYRLKGGNVIHSKTTVHNVLISADAMSISVDADKEFTPGQESAVAVNIKSNSPNMLSGVFVDLELPFGFSIVNSAPPIKEDKTESNSFARWYIGDFRPGEERTLQLSGKVDGQVGDIRVIKAKVGSGAKSNDPIKPNTNKVNNLGNPTLILAQVQHEIHIKRPFLSVEILKDGQPLDGLNFNAGETVDLELKWRNNLSVPIDDAIITVDMGGLALSKGGVYAGSNGFYRSVDSKIIWNSKTSRGKLKHILPGEEGKFKFKITPLSESFLARKAISTTITFSVSMGGKRLDESGVPETLTGHLSTEVKLNTNVSLKAFSLFKSSPFGPLGPLPPKAEYETVYAIVWEVSNTTNDIKDAIVRAELPYYVTWLDRKEPANEQLIYNKTNNTVEWHLGTVKAGTGQGNLTRIVAFAVGLVPSYTQVNTTPDLIWNQTFEAVDTYTNKKIIKKVKNVTTKTIYDEGYKEEYAHVVK